MTTNALCGCHPESQDPGWHEVRSDKCLRAERAQWASLFEHVRRMRDRMTKEEDSAP